MVRVLFIALLFTCLSYFTRAFVSYNLGISPPHSYCTWFKRITNYMRAHFAPRHSHYTCFKHITNSVAPSSNLAFSLTLS
ncbi:hypothetical protein EDB19DRAFT_371014 [Suillus lakei]|nr:hypothetical protein EDB19DRAFT_371014 [Suillus lakei]